MTATTLHQLHYTTTTTPLRYNYNYSCSTWHYIQQLWARWPLQPLQPFQQTQLQPPFGQSVDSLCHPWFTTTNVSYRFPILKLPPPPCAVLLVMFYIPLLPRTKLNVVVQVKPWLYLKTLIDCWYIGHTKGQKRVAFPLSLIESVNQSSKFWIKMGFPCSSFWSVFTGFSLSFHGFFTVTFHALGLEWDLFETLESGIYLYYFILVLIGSDNAQ